MLMVRGGWGVAGRVIAERDLTEGGIREIGLVEAPWLVKANGETHTHKHTPHAQTHTHAHHFIQ
jgi:hypothetical protein